MATESVTHAQTFYRGVQRRKGFSHVTDLKKLFCKSFTFYVFRSISSDILELNSLGTFQLWATSFPGSYDLRCRGIRPCERGWTLGWPSVVLKSESSYYPATATATAIWCTQDYAICSSICNAFAISCLAEKKLCLIIGGFSCQPADITRRFSSSHIDLTDGSYRTRDWVT